MFAFQVFGWPFGRLSFPVTRRAANETEYSPVAGNESLPNGQPNTRNANISRDLQMQYNPNYDTYGEVDGLSTRSRNRWLRLLARVIGVAHAQLSSHDRYISSLKARSHHRAYSASVKAYFCRSLILIFSSKVLKYLTKRRCNHDGILVTQCTANRCNVQGSSLNDRHF